MIEAPRRERLPSGSEMAIEVYRNPSGIAGSVINWGVLHEMDTVRDILEVTHKIPREQQPGDTGFKFLWHQRNGISRLDAIRDEEEVAKRTVFETISAAEWQVEDVDALYLGSGVPITDKHLHGGDRVDNYARRVADLVGLRPDVKLSNTHAACNSGNSELLNALEDEELQGKKVVVLGVEGITYLTQDFNPDKADIFSALVFANAAAALAIQPGGEHAPGNITVFETERVVAKEHSALVAHMTYEHLLDPEDPSIWQDHNGIKMIRGGPIPDGKLIYMNQSATARFFFKLADGLIQRVYERHMTNHPDSVLEETVLHQPSIGVNTLLQRASERRGETLKMPWGIVDDGNSSASTNLKLAARKTPTLIPGTHVLFGAYGAGGSGSGGVAEILD